MSIVIDFKDNIIVNIGNVPLEVNPKDIRGGAESIFLPLTTRQGMKIFYHREEARGSLNRQKKGFKYGLAPSCINKIYKIHFNKKFHEMLRARNDGYFDVNFYFDPFSFRNNNIWYGYLTQSADIRKFVRARILDQLGKKVSKKMGLDIGDICANNVGFIRGKCVVVDWGDLSFSG